MAEAQAIAAVRVSEAARRLEVSAGTIRNWLRTGLLTPLAGKPVSIAADAVEKLRRELGSGDLTRLRSRANKRRASAAFAPSEYSRDRTFSRRVAAVAAFARARRLNVEKVLCFAALRLLSLRKEVELSPELLPLSWRRRNMARIMAPWLRRVGPPGAAHCRVFELAEPGEEGDFLGFLYQSLSRTGLKSAQGSYYTPDRLVTASLRPAAGKVSSFLDPCCGTGNYLVHAARLLQLPLESIHGVDLDPVAARIARLNLLLAGKVVKSVKVIPKGLQGHLVLDVLCDPLPELLIGEEGRKPEQGRSVHLHQCQQCGREHVLDPDAPVVCPERLEDRENGVGNQGRVLIAGKGQRIEAHGAGV